MRSQPVRQSESLTRSSQTWRFHKQPESIRQAEALLICAGGALDLPEGKDAGLASAKEDEAVELQSFAVSWSGVFQRPPLSTLAGSLEYGIPAPGPSSQLTSTAVTKPGARSLPSELSPEGVCSPLRELWREPTAELLLLLGQSCHVYC